MSEQMRRPPRQERSERTVTKVLGAADKLFGELGYDKTTTTLIAKRAGLSVGGLYRFFPGKDAIAASLTEVYNAKRDAVYLEVAGVVLRGERDAIAQAVATMVDGLAALHQQHPGYFVINTHLDPSSAQRGDDPTLEAQGEALIAWFEMAPNKLTRQQAELVAEYTMVMTRVLLERCPAGPRSKRIAHLDEAKFVLTHYLQQRLGIAD